MANTEWAFLNDSLSPWHFRRHELRLLFSNVGGESFGNAGHWSVSWCVAGLYTCQTPSKRQTGRQQWCK